MPNIDFVRSRSTWLTKTAPSQLAAATAAIQRWNTFSILSKLNSHNRDTEVLLSLHTLADDALKVYNGFHFATAEADCTVEEIKQKFEEYAIGEINETCECYIFNQLYQEDETFEHFHSNIQTLIKTCNCYNQCV